MTSEIPTCHLQIRQLPSCWTILLKILTCFELQVGSRNRAGKDVSLIVQATQVARIGVENYKATLGSVRIWKVKGAHRCANILVDMRTTVDPIHVFVPAAICEVAAWDCLCCEDPCCGRGGEIWLEKIPILENAA